MPGTRELCARRYGKKQGLRSNRSTGVAVVYFTPRKEEKALRLAGVKPERTVMFVRVR